MAPDLESLRCFLAVARTLHFRLAGEQLARSPAAVSDRVRRLEDDLGVELFDRTTRRVLLTDAGRRLVPHAEEVLAAAERCAAVARGDGDPLPFSLTLGTRYELGMSWLVPALRPLAAARPERAVHLYMGDTADLLDRLGRGGVDAAVLSTRPRDPRIRQEPLHEERYVLVAREPTCIAPESLASQTLVDVTPDLPLFQYLPAGRPWRFGHHRYMGGIGAIRAAVLDGWGVAVLPEYFVRQDLDTGRLVALLTAERLSTDHFRLLWRDDHPRSRELEALAAELAALPLR